ncbi:O-antigen ligase family protein [Anaerosoma tenue]|uniref:O-antigen ligase family protein n=1 Tax=Anaerosoma tenue TaxID=2933588 RepID=UPI002260F86C|nr:O-antigen ligase family protein [Anaerosoma tenue]MCK8114080.1 O-antigen ligase family protein [Anaerosoma tenue]
MAIAAASIVSWIAYRFRRLSVVVLLVSVLIPSLVQMLHLLPVGWDVVGGGVRLSDLVVIGMWGATAAILMNGRNASREVRLLMTFSVALAVVLGVAVARNWGSYGLSALGEFRFRYLILGLPVYLALGFNQSILRAWAAKLLAWAPVVGVILALPLVVAEKGVGFDEASRLYPSSISLGLLLAVVWMALRGMKQDEVLHGVASYAAIGLAGFIILKDAHRSVWLVAAACVLVLLVTRAVEIRRLWLWVMGVVVVGLLLIIGFGPTGGIVADYVATRSRAFFNPTEDPTSYWRLSVWRAYLQPFLQDPLFGQGFGGYWDVYVPELGARVITSPHSVYVQTLVKVGLVGLASLLAWFGVCIRLLTKGVVLRDSGNRPQWVLVVMGLVAIAATLAYGSVYALDFWPLAWLGLGLAERLHGNAVTTSE